MLNEVFYCSQFTGDFMKKVPSALGIDRYSSLNECTLKEPFSWFSCMISKQGVARNKSIFKVILNVKQTWMLSILIKRSTNPPFQLSFTFLLQLRLRIGLEKYELIVNGYKIRFVKLQVARFGKKRREN